MPRVVPSQIISLIDKLFPWAKNQWENDVKSWTLTKGHSYSVAALLELIQHLPSELIILEPEEYSEFICGTASLRALLEDWQRVDHGFDRIPGLRKLSPVTLIRQALAKCPDEFPSVSVSEINFIEDESLEKRLAATLAPSIVPSQTQNGKPPRFLLGPS